MIAPQYTDTITVQIFELSFFQMRASIPWPRRTSLCCGVLAVVSGCVWHIGAEQLEVEPRLFCDTSQRYTRLIFKIYFM